MVNRVAQYGFSGGVISRSLFGRADLEKYGLALQRSKNCIITKYGGVMNRAGTQFVGEVRDSADTTRIVGFQFNTTQTYILEWGDEVMRPIRDGGQVLEASKNIVSITQASPGVVTVTSHGYSNGDKVFFDSVGGMVELNDLRTFTVANVATHTFTLVDMWGPAVDTTNYTAFTSGGTVSRLYELTFPYDQTEIFDISFAQTADTMHLAHTSYAPRKLTRSGHASWTITTITFGPTLAAPTNPSATATVGSGATTYSYKITAIDEDTGEESLPSSVASTTNDLTVSGNYNTVSWTSVSGAERYIIYKEESGVYGLIGGTTGTSFIDDNILPDLGDTPPASRNPFASTDNYPGVTDFHEGRSLWAGTNNTPGGVWLSTSNLYYNLNVSSPAKADDAVTFDLRPGVNKVVGTASLDDLHIFTEEAEWMATGGGVTEFITPASLVVKRNTARGSKKLKPIVIGEISLHVQRQGNTILARGYSFEKDGYRSNDLTLLAPHFFRGHTIVDWCYQQDPDSIVWCVRDDGVILSLTFVEDQNTFAWADHYLGGTFGSGASATGYGVAESCACIEGTEQDDVYFVVKRTINSATKRYIEKMMPRWIPEFDDDELVTNINEAYFPDAGITYTSASATSTISQLWHLEGQSVYALVDGRMQGPFTVEDGAITLDTAMLGTSADSTSQAHVGLAVESIIEDLPLAQPTQNGARQGRYVGISKVVLKVHATRGVWIADATRPDDYVELGQSHTEEWDDPLVPYTGDTIPIGLDGHWNLNGNVRLTQSYLLPMEVLMIAKDVTIGGP